MDPILILIIIIIIVPITIIYTIKYMNRNMCIQDQLTAFKSTQIPN